MIFGTELAGALYVNWAVPPSALPELPPPLAADRIGAGEGEAAFVTLIHFRQRGLHAEALPWPRFNYPQVNLRICAHDAEAVPAVFLLRELVPAWMVPIARVGGGQPATAARLDFPPLDAVPTARALRWAVAAGSRNAVLARAGASPQGQPTVGDFERTVAFFRDRPRAYALQGRRLRRLETVHPRLQALPMAVEVVCADWLRAQLPAVDPELWAAPHSAFFAPSSPLVVELARDRRPAVGHQVPAPG